MCINRERERDEKEGNPKKIVMMEMVEKGTPTPTRPVVHRYND